MPLLKTKALPVSDAPNCESWVKKDGWWYVGESPSKKSLARLRLKVADCLRRHSLAPWPEVHDHLNMILRGWSNYFRYGTPLFAYRAVDNLPWWSQAAL